MYSFSTISFYGIRWGGGGYIQKGHDLGLGAQGDPEEALELGQVTPDPHTALLHLSIGPHDRAGIDDLLNGLN